MEGKLLTVKEVASHLRVSEMSIYRMIKTGEMAATRVGKHFRIREDDVDNYLESRYTGNGNGAA